MTKAVTQLTSLHCANKLTSRSTNDPENSDNLDSGDDDEENDTQNRVTRVAFRLKMVVFKRYGHPKNVPKNEKDKQNCCFLINFSSKQ